MEWALQTCVPSGDGSLGCDDGSGFGGVVVVLFVIGAVIAIGSTVYKVSTARNLARKSGMDPDDATKVTLLGDDGLDTTYLASSLHPQPAAAAPASAPKRSVTERLEELEQLKQQGLVTQAEYDERRRAILDSL